MLSLFDLVTFSGGIFNTVKWALKLVELATLSEMRFKSAKTDLKMHNPFGYHERLNPDVDTGIGELCESSSEGQGDAS